jgi:uncharacterized protein YpmB
MANGDDKEKYPTWKWIVGILVLVVMMMSGGYINKLDSEVSSLKREKLDRAQYDCDMAKLETKIDKMDGKLDRLLLRNSQ